MKKLTVFTLMQLGTILFSTCFSLDAQAQVGKITYPLINGATTNERPEVGFLRIANSGCTATLISDQHFLTAAHCIDFKPLSFGGLFTIETDLGSTHLNVDRIFSQGRSLGSGDLAVGRLVTRVSLSGLVPANISMIQPSRGDRLTVMGYGCTDRDTREGAEIKRYKEYIYSGSTENLCPGDSGGPVFLGKISDNGAIIRVNSAFGHDVSDIGADAVRFREHILALSRAMEQDGICYRVHVKDLGWMPAVCNGDIAGTTHEDRRIEAIQIWSPNISVCYQAHVQDNGWMSPVCNGEMAGTTGKELRLEAVRIWDPSRVRHLIYQVHVEDIGWQPTTSEFNVAGTTSKEKRMEAIRIWLR